MKKTQLIGLLVMASVLTGCGTIPVPQSKYKFGEVDFQLPKDFTAKNLDLTVKSGTNQVRLKAAYITSKNNPEVISSAGDASVDIINAHYQGTAKLLDAGLKAAGSTVKPVK